jgi:LuxR family maltose regulon positive regulatory protein
MVEKDQVAGGGPPLLACGKPLASLAQIYIEWNQLAEARQAVDKALDYCQKWQHPSHLLECWINLANFKELEGYPQAALAALERAREHVRQIARAVDTRAPIKDYLAQIDLTEMYLRMHMGDFSLADKWQPGNLSGNIYELNLQTLLDIQHGETARAIELAKKILEIAGKTNWLRFQIEGHALLGMIYQKAGNHGGEGRQEICQAMELAEPEGYVRLFLEKGALMHQLLEDVRGDLEKQEPRSGSLLGYVGRLLAAFSPGLNKQSAAVYSQGTGGSAEPEADLPAPLSERERQILRLLAGGLSNDDIAANLFLSTNTVKTHLKRIFEKMGVNSRLEAVTRARGAKII